MTPLTEKLGILLCLSGKPPLIYPELTSILHINGNSPLILNITGYSIKDRITDVSKRFLSDKMYIKLRAKLSGYNSHCTPTN